MKISHEEIPGRTPVWSAFANLYLDAPVDEEALRQIAVTLAASPYDVDELERILFDEVHPVCRDNLRSVAGNWSGFDQAELVQTIITRLDRGSRLSLPNASRREIRQVWTRLSALLQNPDRRTH